MKPAMLNNAAASPMLLPRWITRFMQFLGDLTVNAVMDDAWAAPTPAKSAPKPQAIEPGDIVNEHGDLHFSPNCHPIMEGLVSVSFNQALAAIPWGWHWMAMDGDRVAIMRGGRKWKCRRDANSSEREVK